LLKVILVRFWEWRIFPSRQSSQNSRAYISKSSLSADAGTDALV